MSEERKVLVIEYGKESFVHEERWGYYGSGENPLIINGRRDWPKAAGDESFRVVPGTVTTLEQYRPPTTVTVKYELRSDLVCANKPRWVTPSEFGNLPEVDQLLYSAITEQREQAPLSLPMRVVNGKAAPRKIQAGIRPILPHHVNEYPWFWWTLPCQATTEYIFERLTQRVEALDPQQFHAVVYTNIKTMYVQAHSFSLGGVEFKPSTYLLYIDRDKGQVPPISGTDLDDVLAAVERWCDDKMKAVTEAMTLQACPCCKQRLKKGTTAKLRSREPKYRIGHDISRR